TLRSPRGELIARRDELRATGHRVEVPIEVPRLAPPGRYRLSVTVPGGLELPGEIEITGKPFPPIHSLRIDQLQLYGGPELRAPRAGILFRSEPLRVEVRLGGARRKVATDVKLRQPNGRVVLSQKLSQTEIRSALPDVRLFLAGEVVIPSD